MPSVDNGSLTTLDEPCLRCSSTATIIRGRSNLNRRSAVVATAAHHPPRRKQRAITIRSDHALKRLELLARDGRSQVEIIEERSEERRGGKECVSTGRSRWSASH